MLNSFLLSYEPYILKVYIIHILLSLLVAILLSRYVLKRFIKSTKEIEKRDARRLEAITDESWLFRLLFRVSLHKNNEITNILFMFLFIVAMPMVGYLFAIWITWYLRHVSYEKKVTNTNILNLDEFGMSFLKIERIFGEGSMSDLMLSEYAPKSKKLKALSALSNNPSPANLKIIRQTLSSTDDEIRMFGYAIINKAEKSLNVKINHQLDIFNAEQKKEEGVTEGMASAAKDLAALYWELIYTELSHESLKENFLKDVVKYLEIAKSYYIPSISVIEDRVEEYQKRVTAIEKMSKKEQDNLIEEQSREYYLKRVEEGEEQMKKHEDIATKLYISMGRVSMYKKEYEKAKEEFTLAQQLHTSQLSFVIPYLAEIQFLTGNYRVVKSIMNNTKGLELNPTLFPIVKQWEVS